MSPKKKKTQKLRQELSEYTSLIRALHTASTQDLLPHLIGTFPRPPSVPSSRATSTHPSRSSGATSTSGSKSHQGLGDGKPETRSNSSEGQDDDTRDIWTRWPLLREDVYVPEWTLQDEVKSIAERSAREWLEAYASDDVDEETDKPGRSPHKMDIDVKGEFSDEEGGASNGNNGSTSPPRTSTSGDMATDRVNPLPEEELLTKGVLNGLFIDSSNLLSQTFAVLAAHRPSVDAGLQSRLRTMDWKSAFNVIGSAGFIDQSIMQDVQARMERIHSESDHRALGRRQVQNAAKRKLQDLEDSLGSRGDILHFTRPRKKRRQKLLSDNESDAPDIKLADSDILLRSPDHR